MHQLLTPTATASLLESLVVAVADSPIYILSQKLFIFFLINQLSSYQFIISKYAEENQSLSIALTLRDHQYTNVGATVEKLKHNNV